ncbi:MAG: N-acetylmuramoyl-L-alanine amidase, partial [Clostridia bacterium]|nr:N-acetylmuramoyl-L-alanine amidase [Clostridia bacterium]
EKIKIYIDQGHNPHSYNTGAEGNGYKEQDITYTVGVLLAELLAQDSRFEVRLSRPTPETMLGEDNQSSLQARCDEANGWEADYFISIHANSYTGTGTVSGTEAFSFPTDVLACRLGEEILSSLNLQTGLRNRGLKDGSHLYVLKNTLMPAVLVELGFITHEGDALLMAESPELFVTGLFNGIQAYFFPTEGES